MSFPSVSRECHQGLPTGTAATGSAAQEKYGGSGGSCPSWPFATFHDNVRYAHLHCVYSCRRFLLNRTKRAVPKTSVQKEHLGDSSVQVPIGRFRAAINLFKVVELASARNATPTLSGGGAGTRARTLTRGPAKHLNASWTRATPRPASTDAIRLVALSCSSAICGG